MKLKPPLESRRVRTQPCTAASLPALSDRRAAAMDSVSMDHLVQDGRSAVWPPRDSSSLYKTVARFAKESGYNRPCSAKPMDGTPWDSPASPTECQPWTCVRERAPGDSRGTLTPDPLRNVLREHVSLRRPDRHHRHVARQDQDRAIPRQIA